MIQQNPFIRVRKSISKAATFVFAAGLSFSAQSAVNYKNGNFFVGYTDIVYSGGFEPKWERVCNSKTPYVGLNGPCWGSELETKIVVSADGSIVVKEFGGGAENRFNPKAYSAKELEDAVEKLMGAARQAGTLAGQVEEYKKKLKTDSIFRNDEWEKFVARGLLKPRELAVGTQLVSNRFSYQVVTRVEKGYERVSDGGKKELFDTLGRLIRVEDKNNNFIKLEYGKNGKPSKLEDNFGRKMFFSYDSKTGFLGFIEGENSKKATYQYNAKGELVYSKDVDGNEFRYSYGNQKKGDNGNNRNMVEIAYSDKTTMEIEYYGREKNDSVKLVKERDGTSTLYDYGTSPRDPGNYWISASIRTKEGKEISKSKYEYFTKRKTDGDEWTYKLIAEVDGDRTETTYNECCGLPLLIKRGTEETAFAYDEKGRVVKKTTPSEVTKLDYNQSAGKVSRVEKFTKGEGKNAASEKTWSEFQYDDRANLVFAKNSEGKAVRLFYDANGRIKSLVDQNKKRIDFKYNELSKPIEISDPAVGAITVTYTNSGEIKKVDSSAGRTIATQVTNSFQALLDIIRPAGVSLSF